MSKIEKSAFKNLASLVYLNLKSNDLSIFSAEIIINCPSLSLLVLDRNQFIEISPGSFQQMFLQYVISNDYRICCIVQAGTQCLSKSPKYKTCHKLLNNNTLKIAYITFSWIIIIPNFVSLLLQKVLFNKLCHSYEMIAGLDKCLRFRMGIIFIYYLGSTCHIYHKLCSSGYNVASNSLLLLGIWHCTVLYHIIPIITLFPLFL